MEAGSRCDGRCRRRLSIITSCGTAAAATARASAKLVTIPQFRSVVNVAAATPKRRGGAELIAALVLGE